MCVCAHPGVLCPSLGSLRQASAAGQVLAVAVGGNWGSSLQGLLCVMADIPREEQGSPASAWPCLLCCREWSGR